MAFCWRSWSLERCFFSSLLLLRRNNIPRPGRRAGGVMSWSKGFLARSVCCCSGRWQHKLEEHAAKSRILNSSTLDTADGNRMVRGPQGRRSRSQCGEDYHKVTFLRRGSAYWAVSSVLEVAFRQSICQEQRRPRSWRHRKDGPQVKLLERVQVEIVTFTSSGVRLCASVDVSMPNRTNTKTLRSNGEMRDHNS